MNDQRKAMNEVFKEIEEDLRAIKAYMARRSPPLEEEAREVIEHRLRNRGILLSLSGLDRVTRYRG